MAGCYKLFRPGCICFLSQAEPAGLWPEPNLQSAGAPQGSAQSLDPDSGVPVLASSLPSCAALGHLLNLYECLFHLKKKNEQVTSIDTSQKIQGAKKSKWKILSHIIEKSIAN